MQGKYSEGLGVFVYILILYTGKRKQIQGYTSDQGGFLGLHYYASVRGKQSPELNQTIPKDPCRKLRSC